MNVLLLNCESKSSLACARSLGKKGVDVFTLSSNGNSLSSSSRFIKGNFACFSDFERYCAHKQKQFLLWPVTDMGMSECFKYIAEDEKDIIFPFSSYESYKTLSNKLSLIDIAHKLNILCPRTLISNGMSLLNHTNVKLSTLQYPLVLKPSTSIISTPQGWMKTGVKYAADQDEFVSLVSKEPFSSHPFLIQERIQGPGIGIFLLTEQGRTRAFFAHKRIREKPPSGGVSVVCESIEPPREALDAAKRLFEYVGWTGVGMVEFKMDRQDNRPKLMEVNARFWGSLQLAISAGVDFPYLLYRMALGQTCNGPDSYRTGLRSRWELGDLDHLLIRLKNHSSALALPDDAPSKGQVLYRFCLDFLRPSVRSEIFRWNDPRPFFCEFKRYIRDLRS